MTPGRLAYETYMSVARAPLYVWSWEELSDVEHEAWETAAENVLDTFRQDMIG